jgi:hypothetical protein
MHMTGMRSDTGELLEGCFLGKGRKICGVLSDQWCVFEKVSGVLIFTFSRVGTLGGSMGSKLMTRSPITKGECGDSK